MNLQFKILNLQELVTELTREIAVRTPRLPEAGLQANRLHCGTFRQPQPGLARAGARLLQPPDGQARLAQRGQVELALHVDEAAAIDDLGR